MRVQRVQIEQQMARLQIQSQRARLKVERAERQMEIINEPASMKVDRDYGKISIDATELENNTARRDVYTLQDVFASNSLSQAQQGIKSIAQGGDFVADLPNNSGGSLISALARQRMLEVKEPSYGRSEVPKSPLEITADVGGVNIDWTPYKFEIDWGDLQGPHFSIEPPAEVNIDLEQKPMVDVSVVEMNIPAEPHNVDIQV